VTDTTGSTGAVAVADRPPDQTGGTDGAGGWLLPLFVLIIGMFMAILDISIVNVALPVIQTDLGAPVSQAQWVSTAYSLTEGVMVPISAWLGYRFGLKRLYVLCMLGFAAASTLCGLSTSLGMLIAARILQGIPAGIIPVICLLMLYRIVPKDKFGAAMGIYGLGVVVAPAAGPTLGGVLTDHFNWHYIFLINIPIGLLGAVAAHFVLKGEPGAKDKPLDVLGFLTIAGGLFCLLLALEEGSEWGWTSYPVLGLFAVSSNLLILFVVIERQVEHPLLDLTVLTHRRYLLSLFLIVVLMVTLFSVSFYIPQYLQGPARNFDAIDTGLALVPQALVMLVLMPITGMLYDRFGPRWLAATGMAFAGFGTLMLGRLSPDTPLTTLIISMCVVSFGIGLSMMPIMSSGIAAVPVHLSDTASALSTLTQRVSQAFGLGLLTAMLGSTRAQIMAERSSLLGEYMADDPGVLNSQAQGPGGLLSLWQETATHALTQAYTVAFDLLGAACVLAALLALLLPSGRPQGESAAVAH
jgi:EmrB/QacA subfamily drug resistance transporter